MPFSTTKTEKKPTKTETMTLLVLEDSNNNNYNNNNTNHINHQSTTGSITIDDLVRTLRPMQQDVESPLDNVVDTTTNGTTIPPPCDETNANNIQQSQQHQQQEHHILDNGSTTVVSDNDNNNNNNNNQQQEQQQQQVQQLQERHQQQQQQQQVQQRQLNNNTNNNDGENDEDDNDPYIRQWKQSPFAIGISYPTWKDESIPYINNIMKRICCCIISLKRQRTQTRTSSSTLSPTPSSPFNNDYTSNNNNINNNNYTDTSIIHQRMKQNASPMWCTPVCCRFTPFGRIGNMVVLFQRTTTVQSSMNNNTNIESGQPSLQNNNETTNSTTTTTTRPIVVCMVGPYWPVLVFVTLPILIGLAVLVSQFLLPAEGYVTSILYISVQSLLIFSLLNVSCRNPGIQYRYRQLSDIPPTTSTTRTDNNSTTTTTTNNNTNNEWLWNDQAITYRLKKSVYDRECACIIEEFDHTCPWTGTAIGKNNIYWFYCFLILIIISVVFDAYLFTFRGLFK